jgi:hypothetical protein
MMNNVDDEVDEENEIIESERRRQEKLEFRRQIDSNDPSLLQLKSAVTATFRTMVIGGSLARVLDVTLSSKKYTSI